MDNMIKLSGFRIIRNTNKGASENLKTCRDHYLGLDLSMHVNKTPIHLMTQSLKWDLTRCGMVWICQKSPHSPFSEGLIYLDG